MRSLQSLFRRLQSLFHKESSNIALNEELQFHLERQTEENITAGMSPAQARASARVAFGNIHQAIEDSYQARGVAWIEDLVQDLRYGLRTLLKDRSFTIVIVLTLALGIGSCTAIFSLVNAVLLRSLPYGEAEKLVYLFTPNSHFDLPAEMFGPSYADFVDLKKQSHSYAQMTLFEQKTYNLAVSDQVERVGAARVDGDFFQTLQSAPEIGRVFDASDQKAGSNQVVVLSFGLWQQMFGGAENILGQTIRLDDLLYQVVGVMPREFGFPHKSDVAYGNGHIVTTQLWVPLTLTPREMEMSNRDISNGFVVARLNHGVTPKEAQAEMSTIMSRLDLLHTGNFRGWGALVKSFRDSAFGPVKPLMWLLLGAVGIVLMISCGNAANLLLARAANRTHELGVRATLGARQGRLLRQMLTESLMLGAAAGTLGIALAYLLLHLLLKLSAGDIPRMEDATLDVRVMTFLAGVTVLTSFIFGVLPSLSVTHINLTEFLKM
jgi:predicted permease